MPCPKHAAPKGKGADGSTASSAVGKGGAANGQVLPTCISQLTRIWIQTPATMHGGHLVTCLHTLSAKLEVQVLLCLNSMGVSFEGFEEHRQQERL
eukprot:3359227-Amphidinium_carterae.1